MARLVARGYPNFERLPHRGADFVYGDGESFAAEVVRRARACEGKVGAGDEFGALIRSYGIAAHLRQSHTIGETDVAA